MVLKSRGAFTPFSATSPYDAPPSGTFPPTASTSGEVRAGSPLALPLSEESSSGRGEGKRHRRRYEDELCRCFHNLALMWGCLLEYILEWELE